MEGRSGPRTTQELGYRTGEHGRREPVTRVRFRFQGYNWGDRRPAANQRKRSSLLGCSLGNLRFASAANIRMTKLHGSIKRFNFFLRCNSGLEMDRARITGQVNARYQYQQYSDGLDNDQIWIRLPSSPQAAAQGLWINLGADLLPQRHRYLCTYQCTVQLTITYCVGPPKWYNRCLDNT